MALTIASKATFSAASYAAHRPSYPAAIYNKVLAYHQGRQDLLVDLGTGHGLVARTLAKDFGKVVGTDPSAVMIKQATESSSSPEFANVRFRESFAETLPFLENGSVDMVTAAQASHWFDYARFFPEMQRIMRPGGTLALWGYKDHVFADSAAATEITNKYYYGSRTLGPFWEPGRQIVRQQLRPIKPPLDDWTDITRIEYEPGADGTGAGDEAIRMRARMKLGAVEAYVRTASSFHAWQLAHPEKKALAGGGDGDIVDEMFEAIVDATPQWGQHPDGWREKEVDVEWGTFILLARLRS